MRAGGLLQMYITLYKSETKYLEKKEARGYITYITSISSHIFADLFHHFRKEMVLLQDFEKWHATAFMITGRRGFIYGAIRNGKHALQSGYFKN